MPAALRSAHIFGQVFLLDAEQVDALAAGDLDRRHLVLLGASAMARSSAGVGQAAPHARHDRVGAVLLDVGVGALVDEARLRIVLRLVRPGRDQVVVERRAALVAAVRGFPFQSLEDRFLGWSGAGRGSPRAPPCANARCSRTPACCLGSGRPVGAADGRGEDLLDQAGAGAAGGRRLGVLLAPRPA
jgi:hypothetical protein